MSTRLRILLAACFVLLAGGLLLGFGAGFQNKAAPGEGAPQVSDVIEGSLASDNASSVWRERASVAVAARRGLDWLESEFAAIEALAAGGDETAMRQVGALLRACGSVLGNEYTGRRSARFDALGWEPWRRACSRERSSLWTTLVTEASPPSSADFDALSALPVGTEDPAELAARDRVLEDVLARASDPEVAGWAAHFYMDRDRQLTWADGEVPHSLFLWEGSEALRTEVAIAFACRMGRDCSPFAHYTIAECATTAGCLPGASMQQIIEMRRSPQELQLIEVLLKRLAEIRSAGR